MPEATVCIKVESNDNESCDNLGKSMRIQIQPRNRIFLKIHRKILSTDPHILAFEFGSTSSVFFNMFNSKKKY